MAQISTDEAVEQLHQMFGDYDKGALAAALEAHGGHVERTVEHLLSSAPDVAAGMGGGSGSSGGGSGGGSGGAQSSIDHDAALALQLSREWGDDPSLMAPPPTIPSGIPGPYDSMPASRGLGAPDGVGSMVVHDGVEGLTGSQGSGGNGRRGRRVALPEEFLRVPGWSGGSLATDPQVAADARLAMILQNQSFQRELQSHPELAHLGMRSAGGWGSGSRSRETEKTAPSGPSIREQLAGLGNDMRRKVEELAVRWRMKDPGRAEDTTAYSSVPLMSGQDDADDQAEVVHFAQDGTTRRSSTGSSGGGGYSSGVPVTTSGAPTGGSLFREDSGEERLADPRRSKKDR